MKAITKLFLFPAMVFVLLQCADTYTWLDRTEPLLYLNDIPEKLELTDSIKTSFKLGEGAKYLEFTLTASSPILETVLVDKALRGLLKIDNVDVETGKEIPVSLDPSVLRCVFQPPLNVNETYEFLFRLRDLGDWYSRPVIVKITVFENLLPVANFTVTKKSGNKYLLDATKSYDPDQRKGGGLVDYKYTMTGPENYNRAPLFKKDTATWTLPLDGTYKLVLVVRDNNEKDSAPFSQEVEVK